MNFPLPEINLLSILPEIILTIVACGVLLADLYTPKEKKGNIAIYSIIGIIATFLSCFTLFNRNTHIFNGMYTVDNYAVIFKLIFLVIALLVVLISSSYLEEDDVNQGEYYTLILFSTLGMMIMAAGADLITVYLGLELMALSGYTLVAILKRNTKSLEAALKYFLTGAFASGILLYGIALLYGVTGSTNINEIGTFLANNDVSTNPLLILATIMLIGGFSFKIAAAPFHVWAPDVYEGAPTPITAFLTVGSKFAGFAALARLFITALIVVKPYWSVILSVIAVLTMTYGNVVAIYQKDVKRLLAYSSIAHAGYILIGVIAASKTGIASVLFYAVAYTFMNIGAFTIIILMGKRKGKGYNLDNFKGLSKTNPVFAIVILLLFISLAGIPPTAGFTAKFYIFSAAIEAKLYILAILGGLNSVISVFYYLRVVMNMYMEDSETENNIAFPQSICIALSIMVAFVIALGLFPNALFEATKLSTFL